jgi:hypothetical protein
MYRLTALYRSERSLADFQNKLDLFIRQLPSRFTSIISKLLEELPTIFAPTYPLVLNHGDVCEMNILVNLEAGGIIGVVDWAEAKILPLEMPLWGIHNMLGVMNSEWHYYENPSRLEGLFWDIFNSNAE